jgi:CheY-like chemotaxis protein
MRILVIDDQLDSVEGQELFQARLVLAGPIVGNDEEAWRLRVQATLAKEGFELEFVTDGDVALAHVRLRGPYDLIITDLYHPGLSGIELSRNIRLENPSQAIAVFTVAAIPDSFMEAFWKLRIPVGSKWGRWESLRELVEDAVAENSRRLAEDRPAVQ